MGDTYGELFRIKNYEIFQSESGPFILGSVAGLTYEAFAETPKKGGKQQHKKMEKQEIVDKSVRKTLTIEQHTAEIVELIKM